MREQHGNPQASVRGDFRFLRRANDAGEDEEPQEPDVWGILRDIQTMFGDSGGGPKNVFDQSYARDVAAILELDPAWLYFRDHNHRSAYDPGMYRGLPYSSNPLMPFHSSLKLQNSGTLP